MMATNDRGFDLDDEDRLPWLEAADDYDDESSVSTARLILLVLGGLLLIGAIVGGLWWFQNRDGGRGELITAPVDPYKAQPVDPDAKVFEGEGDSSFAASEGAEPTGKVDPARVPEEPAVTPEQRAAATKAALAKSAADKAAAEKALADKAATAKAAATKVAAAEPKAAVKPAPKPTTVASAPIRETKAAPVTKAAPAASTSGGSATIQLGAFSSEDSASKAWGSLTKRFSFLSGMSRSIAPAAIDGGNVYRLRALAGSPDAANDICRKLKIAGETCIVVR
jgi:cell division protein FtsN